MHVFWRKQVYSVNKSDRTIKWNCYSSSKSWRSDWSSVPPTWGLSKLGSELGLPLSMTWHGVISSVSTWRGMPCFILVIFLLNVDSDDLSNFLCPQAMTSVTPLQLAYASQSMVTHWRPSSHDLCAMHHTRADVSTSVCVEPWYPEPNDLVTRFLMSWRAILPRWSQFEYMPLAANRP